MLFLPWKEERQSDQEGKSAMEERLLGSERARWCKVESALDYWYANEKRDFLIAWNIYIVILVIYVPKNFEIFFIIIVIDAGTSL